MRTKSPIPDYSYSELPSLSSTIIIIKSSALYTQKYFETYKIHLYFIIRIIFAFHYFLTREVTSFDFLTGHFDRYSMTTMSRVRLSTATLCGTFAHL